MDRKPIKGALIVFEGGDGSGKGTQVSLLKERLEGRGHYVKVYDFPRYERFFGQEVGALMRGDYGPLNKVHPFLAAMLYAGDRLDAAPQMRVDLKGCVVLCNRYVSSNLAHGAAKCSDLDSAVRFIQKVEFMEYGINNLPQPDLQLFLDVPAEGAVRMLSTKGERVYMGGRGMDLAEADLGHQEKVGMMYRWLCENRRGYVRIDCALEFGEVKTKEEIEALIWDEINRHFVV